MNSPMQEPFDTPTDEIGSVPETGRIDIHSHLLPAIDDGCMDFEESFECIERLQAAGFVGSICTPHVYPQDPDCNSIEHIRAWTAQFIERLDEHGINYRIWPGGELRLYNGIIDWLSTHQVPTLAQSRCVLVDFWVDKWHKWITPVFEWLLEHGYQPILAHPERLACTGVLDEQLKLLTGMGVWLQGNFRCLTGEDGYEPDLWVRRLASENRYHFMAMDMHRPNGVNGRLDGLQLFEIEFGQDTLDRLTIEAPRQRILSPPPTR